MTFHTKCLKCKEQTLHYSYCDMHCSRKIKGKIYPVKYTMMQIKSCLENNIGCFINDGNISIYSREILEILGGKSNELF